MTWPTVPVDVTDFDADTDSPLLARQDLLDLIQKFNQVIAHVSTFVQTALDDANAAAFRATIGALAAFPAGTPMVFGQTTAPPGWTKSTTHNDKALRVVTGTAGSGGAAAFTSVFGAGKVTGSTTLTTSHLPASGLSVPGLSVPGLSIPSLSVSASGSVALHAGGANNDRVQPAGSDAGLAGTAPLSVSGSTGTGTTGGGTTGTGTTGNMGTGGGHTHTLSLDLQYVDVIMATKD